MNDAQQLRILRQHVETDRLLGVEAVPVGDYATPPAAEPVAQPVSHPGSQPAGRPTSPMKPTSPQASSPVVARSDSLDRETRVRLLREMDENEVRGCTKCGLCEGRTQTVFGEGDPEARLLFIGEGPGQREDETGRPFVGRAGEMLDRQIAAIKLSREQVFIANVVKCRPPDNRAPTPAEAETCGAYLLRQIDIIRPRVIVTLGGPATKLILQTRQGITAIRGTWHQFEGLLPHGPVIPVMPTFHPAYLLRAYTTENRKKVWSDLLAAAERANA